jgi:hypothetical protein
MKIGDFNSKEEVEKYLEETEKFKKQEDKLIDELSQYNYNMLMKENWDIQPNLIENNKKFKNKK